VCDKLTPRQIGRYGSAPGWRAEVPKRKRGLT